MPPGSLTRSLPVWPPGSQLPGETRPSQSADSEEEVPRLEGQVGVRNLLQNKHSVLLRPGRPR